MYRLDINFLDDRAAVEALSQAAERQPIADTQFLIYGGAVALVSLTLVGGAWFFLNSTNEGLRTDLSTLTSKESELNSKLAGFKTQEATLAAIRGATAELVNLFVGNFPVSAITDDIRRRTPITVQVDSITQASTPATPQGAASSVISLSGKATNYNELNDFLLLLKASPLLEDKETKLISSTLQAATNDKNFTLVNFQIRTAITAKNLSTMIPELQKRGADGLVARVTKLKQQGVIK
ncbi:MAG: PilN domain-containing protein [Pseudanabaena sp. ELA748]